MRVKLPEIVSLLFDFLEKDKATEYLDIFFKYLANATDVIKKEDVEESLRKLPQGGEDIMRTWADEFRDEGIVIGEKRGEKRGGLLTSRYMLLESIEEKFDIVPQDIAQKIDRIESHETLHSLFRKTFRCDSLEDFSFLVEKALGKTTGSHPG